MLSTGKLVGSQVAEGTDLKADLEIVRDISEAGLVVDPPSGGTKLWGETTT